MNRERPTLLKHILPDHCCCCCKIIFGSRQLIFWVKCKQEGYYSGCGMMNFMLYKPIAASWESLQGHISLHHTISAQSFSIKMVVIHVLTISTWKLQSRTVMASGFPRTQYWSDMIFNQKLVLTDTHKLTTVPSTHAGGGNYNWDSIL